MTRWRTLWIRLTACLWVGHDWRLPRQIALNEGGIGVNEMRRRVCDRCGIERDIEEWS